MTYETKKVLRAKLAEVTHDRDIYRDAVVNPKLPARQEPDILGLLLKLEPALRDKYTVCNYPEGTNGHEWNLRDWDVDGMKKALEFRAAQAAAEKYAETVVSK